MDVDVEGCASRDETSEQTRQERCSTLDSTTDEGDQDGTRGPKEGPLRLHGDPQFDPCLLDFVFGMRRW